jgi:hypothetical protein
VSQHDRFKVVAFVDIFIGFVGVLAFVAIAAQVRRAASDRPATDRPWFVITIDLTLRDPAADRATRAVGQLFWPEAGVSSPVYAVQIGPKEYRLLASFRSMAAKPPYPPVSIPWNDAPGWCKEYRVVRVQAWGDKGPKEGAPPTGDDDVRLKATLEGAIKDVSNLEAMFRVIGAPPKGTQTP